MFINAVVHFDVDFWFHFEAAGPDAVTINGKLMVMNAHASEVSSIKYQPLGWRWGFEALKKTAGKLAGHDIALVIPYQTLQQVIDAERDDAIPFSIESFESVSITVGRCLDEFADHFYPTEITEFGRGPIPDGVIEYLDGY